ncbi:MAG: hypothetical protein JSW68_11900, partial [Burkholderiales bacterium]
MGDATGEQQGQRRGKQHRERAHRVATPDGPQRRRRGVAGSSESASTSGAIATGVPGVPGGDGFRFLGGHRARLFVRRPVFRRKCRQLLRILQQLARHRKRRPAESRSRSISELDHTAALAGLCPPSAACYTESRREDAEAETPKRRRRSGDAEAET